MCEAKVSSPNKKLNLEKQPYQFLIKINKSSENLRPRGLKSFQRIEDYGTWQAHLLRLGTF